MKEIIIRKEKITGKIDVPTYLRDYVAPEEFQEYCKECDGYNQNWSCPEFGYDVLDYWNKANYLHIFGYRLWFDREETEKERSPEELQALMKRILDKEKLEMADILYDYEEWYPGSISLSAGSCHLCMECERIYDRPCRYPDRMRYSMEALGANVGKTCSKLLGLDLLWTEENKLPVYFVLIGGLLSKEADIDWSRTP